jgi:hypothetical protein
MTLTDILKEIEQNNWEEEVFRYIVDKTEKELKENREMVHTYRACLKGINKINRETKDHEAINNLSELDNM